MKIIFDNNCIDYENFCLFHKLDTFEGRQAELCKSFSKKLLDDKMKALLLSLNYNNKFFSSFCTPRITSHFTYAL